jgi:hypothetical protein
MQELMSRNMFMPEQLSIQRMFAEAAMRQAKGQPFWQQAVLSILGGLGGVGAGAAAAGAFSSRAYKDDLEPVDDEDAVRAVKRLPVYKWRYKAETGLDQREHVGPMAEDFHATTGLPPSDRIAHADSFGMLLAATKGLVKRTERLERRLAHAGRD